MEKILKVLIQRLVAKIRRQRLRGVMRGYAHLRKHGRERLTVELMELFTHSEVYVRDTDRSLTGAAKNKFKLSVHQFLLRRVRGVTALTSSVLFAIGKKSGVVHPLPKEWQVALVANGIAVQRTVSTVLWWCYVLLLFSKGLFVFARTIGDSTVAILFKKSTTRRGYAHFVGLTSKNLPGTREIKSNYDVISWYLLWRDRPLSVSICSHTVSCDGTVKLKDLQSVKSDLPALTGRGLLLYVMWGIAACIRCIVDLLRGHWAHALMYEELSKAACVRYADKRFLASEYLFHHSDPCYRPLWTYEAEAKGSEITMYCYSTNNEPFRLRDGRAGVLHSWQVMSWPRVLVWDEDQARFIRNASKSKVQPVIVGPIWFESSSKENLTIPQGAIAIFDVQPCRDSVIPSLPLYPTYYTLDLALRFLEDILVAASDCGRSTVFKRKRDVNNRIIHPRYITEADKLCKRYNCTVLDPGVHAAKVVANCAGVVSAPFTSTALIGRNFGVPSIFYDPSAQLACPHEHYKGPRIVQSYADLREWISLLN